MKTIGYVMTVFPVLSETFIGTEIRAMQRLGHRIQPISFGRPTSQFQQKDAAIAAQTVYLDSVEWMSVLAFLIGAFWRIPSAIRFAFEQTGLPPRSLLWHGAKLALVANRCGCSHLHAHFALASAATAIVAGKLMNIPVSFVGHGFDVYSVPSDLALKLRNSRFAVAVCEDMRSDFTQLAPAAKVELVYCGVDVNDLKPADAEPRYADRLVFVGRLSEAKGVTDLLKALAALAAEQRPGLDIVGQGVLRTELEACVAQLGLGSHVRFLGVKDASWLRAEIPNYRALVAPFCMGKNGVRDTGPVVVKEAMAMGLPVITTHFMGCKEMVTDETGIRVTPNSPSELAAAISKIMAMPASKRRAMGMAGRARVIESYTADSQAKRLSQLVEAA